jgi:hypothetical protein
MGELIDLFLGCLAIYFLYKLVFDLIMPVTKVASTMRSKIKEMQEQQLHTNQSNKNTYQSKAAPPPTDSEYIDFEEVK